MAGQPVTTMQDVAQLAGVSIATASRVLNEVSTVDPALAERVRAAVQQLDYRPNAVARSLRRNQSSLWAVIVSDIGNPFFTALVRGIEDVAQSKGFSVVLCNSDEEPGKEDQYLKVAAAEKMAGVIISSSGRSHQLRSLVEAGTPIVAIDRRLSDADVDMVLVDNERGAQLATEHLVDAGFQRIACISGPRRLSTAADRLRGYKSGLAARGIAVDESLIRLADFREEGGYQAMTALLELPEPPDAVFGANNMMTIGAVECLADRGITIPTEMGVVGFDEIPWAHLVRPSLTTVRQPTYEVGRTAALLLSERIAAPGRPRSVVSLVTELQIRKSSQRLEPADR